MEIAQQSQLPAMRELDIYNLYNNQPQMLPILDDPPMPVQKIMRSPSGNLLSPIIGYPVDHVISTKAYKKLRRSPKFELDLTNLRFLDQHRGGGCAVGSVKAN